MPKLKKLAAQGFKSFADAVDFIFPTGITAIVGPNGSGKSNVADAIRWVLGEQRMTAMRGRSGEDMIFAGSKKRARAGLARAAIVFDNSDGWLPMEFAEVTVERRTYRDGKTDYLLNGNKVLLRDLRDILGRAGLGRDAHLIIGQGLVDQVLSLRPEQRLGIFEQAAGITPYRQRREDAAGKLEDTRHNLERVQDIVGEIEPRLRQLEKQTARLDQHARLTKALHETLRVWYGYRWGQALSKLDAARLLVKYREDKATQKLEEAEALTGRIVQLRHDLAQQREKLAALHRESSERHAEAERQQRELAVARERRRQMQQRLADSEANLEPLRATLEEQAQEIAALEQARDEAAAQLEAAQAKRAEAEAAHRKVEQERRVLLGRQSKIQSQEMENRHRLTTQQSRLEQVETRMGELAGRSVELERTLEDAVSRRRTQQQTVAEARRALEAAQAAIDVVKAEVAELQRRQAAAREENEQLRRELGEQQADLQQVAARLKALERLHNEGAGLYAGVHAALRAAERDELHGLPGTLATLLHVPPELDRAIVAALGGQLQNIVALRWDDAQAAIAWLKNHRAGRATFLPLDTLRPSQPLRVPNGLGIVGLAADLIDCDPQYRPAVMLTLGRTAVTDDLDAARALHRKLRGGFKIVTLEGDIVRSGGSVTGGQKRQSRGGELLSRERERRQLPEEVAVLRQRVERTQAALRENESQVAALSQEAVAVAERHRAAQRRHKEADRALEQGVRALEKLIQETEWQQSRLAELEAERSELTASRSQLIAACEEAEAALEEIAAHRQEVDGALAALDASGTSEALAERRTQVALRTQEYENQRALLRARRREAERMEQQITERARRVETLEAQLAALAEQLAQLQSRYDRVRSEADALAGQIPPLEKELKAQEKRLSRTEAQETEINRALRTVEQQLSKAEMEAQRHEERVQSLRREIEETLDIVVAELPPSLAGQEPLPLETISSPLPVVQTLPEGLEQDIRDLRTQIRRLEPINPGAQAEYEEVSERHTFLRDQLQDLETASAHLRQIISELDEMMDTSFRTTFKGIATEFSRIFQMLFNGGVAKLKLQEDEGEIVGVRIIARPPGKRTSGLGMLSGGERSLTAVALLFAIMHVSPTPFCILDEVDAMLDEANVGRFRSMLRQLSRRTQFIIITHNRGTVEVADAIYGISMGEDGVSQVLSLSLEDLPPSEVI